MKRSVLSTITSLLSILAPNGDRGTSSSSGSLLGSGVPVIHFMGKGVGLAGRIGNTSGALFFVWTLIALGVTALFSLILSARGLWSPQWGQSR